tara:strand:+ start:7398 stop:7895 length:498 start_codon:yes stop_codon:yes gene_type:complete
MPRSKSWGFPRWDGYNVDREPVSVRLCDYDGCDQPGNFPAPKAPDSREKWYFCQQHVTEYNRNWNYFAGRNKAEAFRRAQEEARTSAGYTHSGAYDNGAESYGAGERRAAAFAVLDLEETASQKEIKAAFRRLVKKYHPDTNPGDKEAARKFQQVTAAYDILSVK